MIDLIVQDDLLLASGEFTTVGGQSRPHLTAMTSATVGVPFHRLEPRVELRQNAPNPFVTSTTFSFSLRKAANVSLQVFDIACREVATLARNERHAAGEHRVEFRPHGLPSGVYHYRLTIGDQVSSRKMLHLR